MKKTLITLISLAVASLSASAQPLLIEAESFENKGGWVVDQQYMDIMGSPYLMAHGMGQKVEDASTQISVEKDGLYNIYVSTYNWTSPWSDKAGAGQFSLAIGRKTINKNLGTEGNEWMWQYAGESKLKAGEHTITLKDMSGFNGRVDAIYISDKKIAPPTEVGALTAWRRSINNMAAIPSIQQDYDFVVIGGGISGMCAAMAAARQGMQVVLVNDRPLWGGCNSSEIRVHLGGHIEVTPYENLGNMIKEFGHTLPGNAEPASNYEDEKKADFLGSNPNLTLMPSTRMTRVVMNGDEIEAVVVENIETGEETLLRGDLFADCTGDGTVGALAGADFMMGRESRYEYGETLQIDMPVGYGPGIKGSVDKNSFLAPEKADSMTMGASVQWYALDGTKTSKFPEFNYGVEFNEDNKEAIKKGDWNWETGMNKNQLTEAEYVRDYGLMVIYSNWSYMKNHAKDKANFRKSKLEWVAYIAGRRESRRLMGDYILTAVDIYNSDVKEDGTATTTWSMDLHYPNPDNAAKFGSSAFKSISKHVHIDPYPVPYRCLYSRNVNNLFMAGRNISVTHAALGTVRVMRTCGMMGEVVGLAASVCHKKDVLPRRVYQAYLSDLESLMEQGAGKQGLENNQNFNTGSPAKSKRKKN